MTTTNKPQRVESGEARFGLQVAALLNDSSSALPADVDARLRQIRFDAVQRRQPARPGWLLLGRGSSAALGAEQPGWRLLLGLALALPVLVLGLQLAQVRQHENVLHKMADVDTALLLDEVPPQAYLDPGFKSYLGQNP